MATNGAEQVVNYEDLAALENEFDDAEIETCTYRLIQCLWIATRASH